MVGDDQVFGSALFKSAIDVPGARFIGDLADVDSSAAIASVDLAVLPPS
jgi:hypothetical protein